MSFRILNAAPQYLLPDGRVNAGGSLTFYETDLTTLKGTWSDPDMSVPNANPVILDAAGRAVTDIWGDGEYGVVMRDAGGVALWTRNNVRDVDNPGAVIPALVGEQFLTNDGSVLAWQPILQVPDPTGSDGYILSTDGVNPIWIPQPEMPEPPVPPDPDIVVSQSSGVLASFQGGVSDDAAKFFLQTGTGTAPATGLNTSSIAVSFPVSFQATPFIFVTPTVATAGGGGFLPTPSVQSSSSSGFTVKFDTNGGSASNSNITNPVTFSWVAMGVRNVP